MIGFLTGLGLGVVGMVVQWRVFKRKIATLAALVIAVPTPSDPATDRQRAYLADLMRERDGGDALAALDVSDPWAPDLTIERAFEAIERLRASPRRDSGPNHQTATPTSIED